MEISEFAFKILLLFFPGLICSYCIDYLTIHQRREPIFFLLRSFILGIISYFMYWSLIEVIHLFNAGSVNPEFAFLKALLDPTVTFSFQEIAYVTGISILMACVVSVCSSYKLVSRFVRKIRLTRKFGELDVWSFMFNLREVVWVTVRDHENNLAYDGWVQAFSDDAEKAEVLLRNVSLYKNDTAEFLYQVEAIYLSLTRGKISIECRANSVMESAVGPKVTNEAEDGQQTPEPTPPNNVV